MTEIKNDLKGASIASLSFPKTRLAITAVLGSLVLAAAPDAEAKNKENTKAKTEQKNYLSEKQIIKGLELEPASSSVTKQLLSNSEHYSDIIAKIIKDSGTTSRNASKIYGLLPKMDSENLQTKIIEILKNDQNDHPVLERFHLEAVKNMSKAKNVSPAVVDFIESKLATKDGSNYTWALVEIKDPKHQVKVQEILKDLAENKGNINAIEIILDKKNLTEQEKYLVDLTKNPNFPATDISSLVLQRKLKNPELVNYIAKVASETKNTTAIALLAALGTPESTQAMIKLLDNKELRASALFTIAVQQDESSVKFMKNFNLDLSDWKSKELEYVLKCLNMTELKSPAFRNAIITRTVQDYFNRPDDNKADAWDLLIATQKLEKSKESFTDYLVKYLDPEKDQRIIRLVTEAKQIGIDNPSRFNTDVLDKIIATRNNVSYAKEKSVLFIQPKVEIDGTFQSQPEIMKLLEMGYDVIYYETGTDDLKSIIDECKAKNLKGDAVFLMGHGLNNGIAFGGAIKEEADIKKAENLYLDTSDRAEIVALGMHEIVKPSKFIVTGGCKNGSGKDNLKETLAGIYKDNQVLAPDGDYTNCELSFDSSGVLNGIKFVITTH